MIFIKEKGKGLLVCFGIAAAALLLGQWIPIIGGPVFAILIGMLLAFRIRGSPAGWHHLHLQENPAVCSHFTGVWLKSVRYC